MPSCKILIVDDDIDDVEILADAFAQTGVERVHFVYSAMQAFMYLQSVGSNEQLPKLIVTDMYLPGISGAEFLKDLKGMEKYRHIHVIVLSGVKTPNEAVKYKELGAIDYLLKPNTYDEYVMVAKRIAERLQE
ncbi:MAG: response regulator [Chitinophagaceae bacterium]